MIVLQKQKKTLYLPDPEELNLDDGRSLNHSQPLDQQPTTRQSGRARRKPVWTKDYQLY